MPADGYLRSLLAGAARPMRHRGGVRDLLGLPEPGARVGFTTGPRATGFVYRHAAVAAPSAAQGTSWQVQVVEDPAAFDDPAAYDRGSGPEVPWWNPVDAGRPEPVPPPSTPSSARGDAPVRDRPARTSHNGGSSSAVDDRPVPPNDAGQVTVPPDPRAPEPAGPPSPAPVVVRIPGVTRPAGGPAADPPPTTPPESLPATAPGPPPDHAGQDGPPHRAHPDGPPDRLGHDESSYHAGHDGPAEATAGHRLGAPAVPHLDPPRAPVVGERAGHPVAGRLPRPPGPGPSSVTGVPEAPRARPAARHLPADDGTPPVPRARPAARHLPADDGTPPEEPRIAPAGWRARPPVPPQSNEPPEPRPVPPPASAVPQAGPVVVATPRPGPAAFWERRHIGRLRGRIPR
jgi:hypothetical protein